MSVETADFVTLYRRAFREFAWALWNRRMLDAPEPADALVVPGY